MQVFLIILCRKIIFWLLSSPFPTLFLSFSYLQYNNKPKSQENASVLSKNLLKMLTKGGKKLATNSRLIFSPLHFLPLSPTVSFLQYILYSLVLNHLYRSQFFTTIQKYGIIIYLPLRFHQPILQPNWHNLLLFVPLLLNHK